MPLILYSNDKEANDCKDDHDDGWTHDDRMIVILPLQGCGNDDGVYLLRPGDHPV